MERTEQNERELPPNDTIDRSVEDIEAFVAQIRAQRERMCPVGTARRALDERMVTDDGVIRDDEAEKIEADLGVRFGASKEAAALTQGDTDGFCPRILLKICREARNVVLTRLGPEHVKAALLDDLPLGSLFLRPSLAPTFVASLRAFFEFVSRELELPAAKQCAEVLDLTLACEFQRALELNNVQIWRDAPAVDAGERSAIAPLRTATERNRKKALRKAQKAGRRLNR